MNQYNGYSMKVYQSNPYDKYALPDNDISSITEDDEGNLWVGTVNKGLFLFDKKQERFIPVSLGQRVVNAVAWMHIKNDKMLVFVNNDLKIFRLLNRTAYMNAAKDSIRLPLLFSYNQCPNPVENFLGEKGRWFDVRWMQDMSLWLSMKDTMLILHPDQQLTHWTPEVRDSKEMGMGGEELFHFMSLSQKNQVILIGLHSLSVYDWSTRKIIFFQPFGNESITKDIFFPNRPIFLNDTTIFFCTNHSWYRFNAKTQVFTSLVGKSDRGGFSGISHLLDRDGILWVGSSGSGVYKTNLRALQFTTDPEDCYGFAEGNLNPLFIRFKSGVALFDPNHKKRMPIVPDKLWNKDWIWPDIWCADPQGSVWIRAASKSRKSPDGKVLKLLLLCYDPAKQTNTEYTDFYDPQIYVRFESLIKTFTNSKHQFCQVYQFADPPYFRLIVCDPQSKQKKMYALPVTKNSNNAVSRVFGHYEDEKGNLWLGTDAGLFYFDAVSEQWIVQKRNPKDSLSLSSDKILTICPDPQHADLLWLGTNGSGFDRFDITTRHCKHYSHRDGLPNNVVYGILSDDFGNLWMSTNQGISCFNIKSQSFRNYTTEDGLPGNEYNSNQFLKARNGMMYFGGVDGITCFYPKTLLSHILPPNELVFTGFSIYNKPVDFKTDSSILTQSIAQTEVITLPADKNMFTFEFALLQYSQADRKQYQYFLEGFDKNWIDNGARNTATFTNLDPGEYTLHVKGCNSDGVWTKESKSIVIIIKAPWHRTWWFKSLLVLFIGGATYALYRYRLYQSLKVISMRNIIASDLHDEIGSTISSISVYSDIIESQVKDKELQHIAERISNSSRNILVVMSDIVWSINPKNDRFDNVILRMKSFALEVLEIQNKKLHFDADIKLNDIKMQMNDRKNFYLIFKEALNNAVKYAHAGNVWISITLIKNELLFVMKDDGIGFDIKESGEGNGLLNMQRRTKDLRGNIEILSAQNQGTEIRLHFPV
ncbi:signal transduction histidine-protein kinase/phosphatase DegS [Filimonas sp.]|nr:signal transduction histidine-protein kinase/phosphatase DegS [Filimonas sp.]